MTSAKRRLGLMTAAAALLGAAAAPAAATAAVETVTVRQGPLTVGAYEVRYTSRQTRSVRTPRLEGWLVGMHARLVDRGGRPLPVSEVMLHHVVYKNPRRRDALCGGAESFYGTGEENQSLRLPLGYGYRLRRSDRWTTGWMLMNHTARVRRAYIEYTARVETSRRLRPVTPLWARVTGCSHRRDPIFSVAGGGPPGSTVTTRRPLRVPRSGRIVAGGAHVHGGSRGLLLERPRCRRPLMVSRPLYGTPMHPYYNVLPVLHEPGPVASGWVTSRTGIRVLRGERLRVAAPYDGERPHTRVMGIWHLYLAPARGEPRARRACPPPPRDLRHSLPPLPGRSEPPAVTVPLTGLDERGVARAIDAPPGPLLIAGRSTVVPVTERSYGIRNLSVPLGGEVRWEFRGRDGYHDVTLASGPVGFASRWSLRGQTYSRRFDVAGDYRIFCSLHPVAMTQRVTVRPSGL